MDTFKGFGVRVRLPEKDGNNTKERTRDSFLVIKETLTRIGITSPKTKSLYQSCHILQKRNEFAILHFKELFSLDGKTTDITDDDIGRRNAIVQLLEQWNLLKILEPDKTVQPIVTLAKIKIIPFSDKKNWILHQKYQIGSKKN